jgi:hypothetical protein
MPAIVISRLRRSETAHRVDDALVVGRHHDGRAGPVDAVEDAHDADGGRGVEVPGRLVGEHDQRPVDERPRDRDALLLTAGQLVREPPGLLGETDEVEHLRHLRADHVPGAPDDLHRERDVLVDGARREELEVLEDRADVSAELRDLPVRHARDVAARDDDLTLGGRLFAQQKAEEGRLPRPGRTDEEDELPLLYVGRHVAERGDATLVDLGHVFEADHGVPGEGSSEPSRDSDTAGAEATRGPIFSGSSLTSRWARAASGVATGATPR